MRGVQLLSSFSQDHFSPSTSALILSGLLPGGLNTFPSPRPIKHSEGVLWKGCWEFWEFAFFNGFLEWAIVVLNSSRARSAGVPCEALPQSDSEHDLLSSVFLHRASVG